MGRGLAAAWAEAANLVHSEPRPVPGKSLRNPKTLFLGFARKYPAPDRRGQLRTQEVGRGACTGQFTANAVTSCWQRPRSTSPPSGRLGREGEGQAPGASGRPSRWLSFCPGPGIGEPGVADEPLYGEHPAYLQWNPQIRQGAPGSCLGEGQLVSREGTLARPPHLPASPLTASHKARLCPGPVLWAPEFRKSAWFSHLPPDRWGGGGKPMVRSHFRVSG